MHWAVGLLIKNPPHQFANCNIVLLHNQVCILDFYGRWNYYSHTNTCSVIKGVFNNTFSQFAYYKKNCQDLSEV